MDARGDASRAIHFQKGSVELMLSSNWHVTLRLAVFEIFAVNWLLEAQNFGL